MFVHCLILIDPKIPNNFHVQTVIIVILKTVFELITTREVDPQQHCS